MFEPDIVEQNSLDFAAINNNSVSNNRVTLDLLEPFSDSFNQNELTLSSGFELDFFLQDLAEQFSQKNNSIERKIHSRNLRYLSDNTDSDVLTGLAANDFLASSLNSVEYLEGTLRADNFDFTPSSTHTVISGNGNIDFGDGELDLLDLSQFSVGDVTSYSFASTSGGGILYDTGEGARVFDYISLADGSQILFEGIDSILFSNWQGYLSVVPNDPEFANQWNLHMMGVHNAWRFTQGSSEILIGVQDTGLEINFSGYIHPDLDVEYYDISNLGDDLISSLFTTSNSHGTSVQGIISAISNNGIGTSGINWYSDVAHYDVLGGDAGDYSLYQATQAMIDQANLNGQRLVVNMSLGIDATLGEFSDPLLEQLVAENQDNALFVIASGNDDFNSISFPASLAQTYDNVIAVGASWGSQDYYGNATTPGERISYDSWFGWGSNYGSGLTLMGPSEVLTTNATRWLFTTFFDTEYQFNGTSAAAPNVAGVASLVWSVNPDLTATQMQQILSETAYDLGTPGYDTVYGNGFVNADAAVRRAMALV